MVGESEANEGEIPDLSESGVRARVNYVADLMRRHAWDTRVTTPALAEKWGLSESTIGNYAAEASRIVVAGLPTGEWGKAGFMTKAQEVYEAAMQAGAYAAALESQKWAASLCGHSPTTKTKTELSGPDGGPIQTAGVVVLPPIDPEGE